MSKKFSLKDSFKKKFANSKIISTEDPSPDFWLSTGNKLINKIISGRYDRGYPQGRVAGLMGLSGAGKSFLIASAMAQAQRAGYFILVVDSENALDADYLTACGVDVESDNYLHVSVSTLGAGIEAVHNITQQYHDARSSKTIDELPRLLLVFDSLDFMFTDSMIRRFEDDGEMGNDQGLHSRKMKQMLQTLVADIKFLPAVALCTKQVYMDQTPHANPPVKTSEAVKFAFTQMLLITRLMERDAATKSYEGIKLRVFGWKTRGCKPFQRCSVVVPYDAGMDEYEGLLPIAADMGIVTKAGSWFTYKDFKWQGEAKWRDLDVAVKEEVFQEIVKHDIGFINVDDGSIDETDLGKDNSKTKKGDDIASAVKKLSSRKAKNADPEDVMETEEAGE